MQKIMESSEINSNNEVSNDVEDVSPNSKLDVDHSNSNSTNTNNIFLSNNNLNHEDKVILNKDNPPNSFRELSIVFSKSNITRILNIYGLTYDTVLLELVNYGKQNPIINNEEAESIISRFLEIGLVENLYEDCVTSFINRYRDCSINSIVSYHIRKSNSKAKRNSNIIGTTNLIFNINVDRLRTLCFGIEPNDMTFNPLEDREIYILDYVKVYWILYMLLVFYKICEIAPDDETSFFEHFRIVIQLAMFTGMKMFVQFELSCHYGELYEELKELKPYNGKYMFVEDIVDKQQICFTMKNADFLNEAYRKEYKNPKSIPVTKDVKIDKHVDIGFYIMKGSCENSVLFEVSISGQNPIGRIFSCETNPEIVINMTNMYYYGLPVIQPVVFLFRQILAYSQDSNKLSYYTEIHNYLKQFKGKRIRNLVPKYLEIIILLLYEQPNAEELEQYISKHFAPTDKVQKAEFRRIYKELVKKLAPKEICLIDKLKKELWNIVW